MTGISAVAIAGLSDSVSEPLQPLQLTEAERQWLASHPRIRVGIDPAWQPFEFRDADGVYRGMAADYLQRLNELLGLQLEPLQGLDWSEVIWGAEQKTIDVLPCVTATERRHGFLNFTEPYLKFPMIIATRDDASYLTGLEMLRGKKVGIVDGYATHDLVAQHYPKVNLVPFTTLAEGLSALSTGRIDAFVDNLASVSYEMRQEGLTNIKVAAETPYSFELGIGVRDDWPELVSILNKALAAIDQAERDRIHNDWISLKFEHGQDLPLMFKIGMLTIAVVLLLMTVFVYSNRRLRAEVELRKRAEQTLLMRNEVLDSISTNHKLKVTLEILAGHLQEEYPQSLVSILLLDRDHNRLMLGAAPGLPDFFNQAINGIPVEEGVGSCGTAAATGRRVIVEDIDTHPWWRPYAHLARRANLRACWSVPIMASDGTQVLGTFGVYYRQPGGPEASEIKNIQEAARLATMAIEHEQIRDSLNKLSLAVEHSPNSVVITALDGEIEYANPKFTELTGYHAHEVIGRNLSMLKAEEQAEFLTEALRSSLQEGAEWQGELQIRRLDGESRWVREFIGPIYDEAERVTHFVVIQEDITESRRISEEISYQASHDALTGLINRREFERRLSRVVSTARRDSSEHVLCFLDLDQFKILNDTCGHLAGDEMLRQLAALLHSKLRVRDTLARLGGDEFAILMEHCPLEAARQTAEAVRQEIEDFRFYWEDHIFTPGVSIGLAAIDRFSEDATHVLKYADTACYAAKDSGRNRIHVYRHDDEMMTQKQGDFQRVSDIRFALEHGHFSLCLQPICPLLDDSQQTSYEVLVRMNSRNGETLMPGAFLPVAERYNLSTAIDRWVVSHVFDWLNQNPQLHQGFAHLAINLSGHSLDNKPLLTYITENFDSGRVPANKIVFEITETAAIGNLSDARVFIEALRDFGCRFALDDFGSGLSSFAYLKNLPVDVLKIDGMFVKDIIDDPIDAAMVQSINDIGHVMGMTTIAEFVENDAIRAHLIRLGVDFGQGYGLGRPQPLEVVALSLLPAEEKPVQKQAHSAQH